MMGHRLPPLAVSYDDAARLLGVSRRTLSNLVRDGQLPTTTISRRPMFSLSSLRQYVASRESTRRANQ